MPPHKGPHHHHEHHHHSLRPHDDRLVEMLRQMIKARRVIDVDQLAQMAEEREPSGDASSHLRTCCQDLSPELAIEQLAAFRRAQTYRRQQALVGAAAQMTIAIVPPIPPHLFDMFGHMEGATILQLDHHELPPHLRGQSGLRVLSGPYESRRFIKTAGLVLFDAYANGVVQVRHALADLLDGQVLKREALLRAHFRPHPAPEDVELPDDIRVRIMQI